MTSRLKKSPPVSSNEEQLPKTPEEFKEILDELEESDLERSFVNWARERRFRIQKARELVNKLKKIKFNTINYQSIARDIEQIIASIKTQNANNGRFNALEISISNLQRDNSELKYVVDILKKSHMRLLVGQVGFAFEDHIRATLDIREKLTLENLSKAKKGRIRSLNQRYLEYFETVKKDIGLTPDEVREIVDVLKKDRYYDGYPQFDSILLLKEGISKIEDDTNRIKASKLTDFMIAKKIIVETH
jgi:hypothetical protein